MVVVVVVVETTVVRVVGARENELTMASGAGEAGVACWPDGDGEEGILRKVYCPEQQSIHTSLETRARSQKKQQQQLHKIKKRANVRSKNLNLDTPQEQKR